MTFDDARKPKKMTGELPAELAVRQPVPPSNQRVEDDKEQYTCFYNRIYPLLKEGRLDFHRIAEKTGHKERRVRETLLFRLTSGEVMQLFGKKEGFCYICSRRMVSSANKEPVCLACLSAIDIAIQTFQSDDLKEHEHARAAGFEPSDMDWLRLPEPGDASRDILPEPVPRVQYETLMSELEQYRTRFGPLEARSPVSVSSALDAQEPRSESQEPETESQRLVLTFEQAQQETLAEEETTISAGPEAGAAFLDVLTMKDEDLTLEDPELEALVRAHPQEPLRHFGFQRLRHGNER